MTIEGDREIIPQPDVPTSESSPFTLDGTELFGEDEQSLINALRRHDLDIPNGTHKAVIQPHVDPSDDHMNICWLSESSATKLGLSLNCHCKSSDGTDLDYSVISVVKCTQPQTSWPFPAIISELRILSTSDRVVTLYAPAFWFQAGLVAAGESIHFSTEKTVVTLDSVHIACYEQPVASLTGRVVRFGQLTNDLQVVSCQPVAQGLIAPTTEITWTWNPEKPPLIEKLEVAPRSPLYFAKALFTVQMLTDEESIIRKNFGDVHSCLFVSRNSGLHEGSWVCNHCELGNLG